MKHINAEELGITKEQKFLVETLWRVVKSRENAKNWANNNPETKRKIRSASARKRRKEDPKKHKEIKTKWRLAHPDRDYVRKKRWNKNNPEKTRCFVRRRRVLKAKSEGTHTLNEWLELCAEYNNACASCGKVGKLTEDHVVPLSKGGSDYISNIQPLCGPCNSHKGVNCTDYRTPRTEGFN